MKNIFPYLFLGVFIVISFDKSVVDNINHILQVLMVVAVLGWLILSFVKRDFGVDQNPEDNAVENDNIRRKFYDIM